ASAAAIYLGIDPFQPNLTLENFDLNKVTRFTDDLSGARLLPDEKVTTEDVKNGKADGKKPNRGSGEFDPSHGGFILQIPGLELAGFNKAFPGRSIRTGRVTLEGLTLRGSISDRGYHEPIGAKAHADRAKVADAVYADQESIPGGLLAIALLGLTALDFKTGA